ncbi:MAG: FHA domain-containing protein [Chloroflexi bacterium]|nr:MAG: FHA domain-containing protein [Chloroflexota bacterium]
MHQDKDELDGLIGKSLGQFRVAERIGAGGMAAVFRAYQPTLDRYVAVKVLPAFHAQDPIFVKRFVQEARSVARLAHPNIVQIHDFGEQENVTYIVMEYVDGGTLKDRLKKPLTVSEASYFIMQAAEGLDCAHRNGIVHRDVKPANMLVRKDGHLLLSDFGIAKILEASTNLTRAGTGIGTPQYMSPEQGTGQAVDRRSDIYSLGIVFFHCLTGRVPFTADNPLTITIKHLHDPLPADRLIAENVPATIVQVILQMTAKQPHERYQSAETLIDALTRALLEAKIPLPRASWSIQPMPMQSVSQPLPPMQAIPAPVVPLASSQIAPASITLTCFRCGAPNPSTRLYCTTCGDDLSNKRAASDRFLGQNGRPVLALLSIRNGPMAGRAYRFHQDVTTIGRTNGNDLVISGLTVSRRHARLWFDQGRWYLEDLQSANGTMVNNMRITRPVALNDGDIVNFGDEVVVFNVTYGP